MGYSSYSDDFYNDRVANRVATNTPTFSYDADINAGKVKAGVHDSLNIKGKIRESRDSKEHPNSTPIAVIFDETGSMGEVPRIMQSKLPQLMGLLLRKGYIEDPQVLFGAVGDWPNREAAPLQIGQFESGIEMDDNITHIYLEGNGGGQKHESYQNALYYFAHRTSCDAYEKRGKKGYCNTPDAPIWMADQTFKPIGEVKVGDKVMGWEHLNGRRSLVVTTVEAVQRRHADNVVRVTMESGRVLTCTNDHRWLSGHHGASNEDIWTSVLGRTGEGALLSHVVDPLKPLPAELQQDAAWLAGIYDGEGNCNSISQDQSHNPEVCKRIEQTLTRLGFDFNYRKDSYFLLGGLQTYVKILALPITRRKQLLDLILYSKWAKYEHGEEERAPTLSRTGDRVVKVEPLPPQDVVSMQTTTHNYIAWGYASSNCFLIGDELAFEHSTKEELADLIGVNVEKDVSFEEILAAAKEKWEIFFILPYGTSYWNDKQIETFWKKALGENFIRLEDPNAVCETIGATIGLLEGTTDVDSVSKDLKDIGASDKIVKVATAVSSAIAKDRALAKVGTGSLPAKKGRSEKNERL
jgi:hypothetical protein